MFLRSNKRFKNGKSHRYWNIVENKRTNGNRIVQRQVLYLGEINDNQQDAWRKTIEVFEEGDKQPKQMSLFPEEVLIPESRHNAIHVRLNELQIKNPRQWGACWLFCELWNLLEPDRFWKGKLYRCLDKLIEHKEELFSFLRQRWQNLFNAKFDVLLYDLTSTYFECDPPDEGIRKFGHSRDKRSDCVQVVIALIVHQRGFLWRMR